MNKQGFSLIELLISLLVLVCLVSAFSFVFGYVKFQITKSTSLSQATLLIQSEMEKLRRRPFALLATTSASSFAGGKGQIMVAPISVDLIRIQINYNYNPPSAPIKLYTLRSAN